MSQYQLAVYQRRLTRFPEAFNSVPNLLTELLDHTYRRGGRTVTITVDYDAHELTFQDDGPGVADPTELFPAKFRRARAGRAPAGIGLVILLHMATQVEITARTASDSWRASFPIHPPTSSLPSV